MTMRRCLWPLLFALGLAFGGQEALAASTINSLPPITSSPGVFPLPDPGCTATATSNYWISQGNGQYADFRIDPLRAGYIFQGNTAPSCPFQNQLWWNTSTAVNALEVYVAGTWAPIAWLDTTNALWIPPIGGGPVATIPAAGTTDLCSSGATPNSIVNVSGSGTGSVASFGSSCLKGAIKYVNWVGTPPPAVVNSGSLIIPGGANVSPQHNDVWTVAYLGSGTWQVYGITAALGGTGVSSFNGRVGTVVPQTGDYNFNQISGVVPPTAVPAVSAPTYRNLKASLTTTNTSIQVLADAVVVTSALSGGSPTYIGNYNQTFNGINVGPGGMDVGAMPANGWLALYAIYNPTTQTASILGYNCATACGTIYAGANMPAGYTQSALLTTLKTNASSSLVPTYVRDKKVWTQNAVAISTNINIATASAVSLASSVPPNAVSFTGWYQLTCGTTPGAVTTSINLYADASNGVASAAAANCASVNGATFDGYIPEYPMGANQTLYWTATVAGTSPTVSVNINGYTVP
jgi:hypothetical protein